MRLLYKYNIIFFFCTLTYCDLQSQDIHFSQFNSSPLNLNPALTGDFDGEYRFAGNHRRQWASVSVPYQTFGVSAEAKQPLSTLPNLAAGLAVYTDKAGDSHFTTTQINISGAYKFQISRDSTQFLILGVQSGITERKLDYTKLSFDNQYNGYQYDSKLSNNESFVNNKRTYPNFNIGLNYHRKLSDKNRLSIGLSWFNISKPKQTFQNDNSAKLDRRVDLNTNVSINLKENLDLIPSALIKMQGTYREFIIGSNLKYTLHPENYNYQAIYVGGWLRSADAAFVSIGMDYKPWHFGVSYDINLSNLRPASNGRGGFEFAVIYILKNLMPQRNAYKVCPNYI